MEEKKKRDESSLPKLRTFKTDSEIYIKENRISKLDMAARGYRQGASLRQKTREKANYNKLLAFILLGILGLGIVGAGGYYVYILITAEPVINVTVTGSKPYLNFISTDAEKDLSLGVTPVNKTLIDAINTELVKNLRFNSVVYFKISKEQSDQKPFYIDSQEFIRLMGWNPPAKFTSAIKPEYNPLIVYSGIKSDLAVIFRTDKFSNTLEGLLEWEKNMWKGWIPFMSIRDISILEKSSFSDSSVRNNDSRVLRDPTGEIILAYSIFNRQFLVMTTSQESLSLIMERLIAIPPRN
jgi:hypothetical protein